MTTEVVAIHGVGGVAEWSRYWLSQTLLRAVPPSILPLPPPLPSVGRRYHLSEKKYTLFFCACRICRGTFSSRYQDFSRYPAYGHLKQLGKKRSSLEEKKSALETTTITKTTIPHPHPHPPPTHTHTPFPPTLCAWNCAPALKWGIIVPPLCDLQ